MLDNLPILSMIIFSPLLGVLILMFIPKEQGRWIKIVGVATAFPTTYTRCIDVCEFRSSIR